MNKRNTLLTIFLILNITGVLGQNETQVSIKPKEYPGALRNPLKGFTTTNVSDHPWASLSHTYIRWNELENNESDGIEKILSVSNQKWQSAAAKNMKVISRVYLHWDGDKKYWPEDMQEDDYTSAQFQARVQRLIERLGICWDNDPRVAFIELGIFGKWGEHHSPSPTAQMQKLVGDAFARAFKNKKVSVRQNWQHFTQQPFGEYWDSWAHYDQMWGHGNSIKKVNEEKGRYKETYVGGEVAYNWGSWEIQPGATPTASVTIQKHRDFVTNSIRWLHCTQLKWITNYDQLNADARKGAEEIQKVFGYRYVIDSVEFWMNDSLNIEFSVTNMGSAPFYYNWPVEVALLDTLTNQPVWKSVLDSVDIRKWLPGEGWTDPEWQYVGSWQEYHPNINWNSSSEWKWAEPPAVNNVSGKFKIDVSPGTYILSLAILDPAGNLPSMKFATGNYLKGGRHPMGLVDVGENKCYALPANFPFDDPNSDKSLYYDDDFDIVYERDPEQKPYGGKSWQFPTDTVAAWQYDYMYYLNGDKYFSLDSSVTIGIYGCEDTTGINIRSYQDSVKNPNTAQFYWNQTDETFQKSGQWLKFTADFQVNEPYQLLLRARNNINSNFKLTILNVEGETVFFKDFNLQNDFKNLGGANETTDWYLSKIPFGELWGTYEIKFDWYDNVGKPGVFGEFSFILSELDATPPQWYFVSIGTFSPGTNIVVMTTEDATVYLVPDGTPADTTSITEAVVSFTEVKAYTQANVATSGVNPGDYIVYAIDSSNNISEASKTIILQYPVSIVNVLNISRTTVMYNPTSQSIQVRNNKELYQVNVYNALGKKEKSIKCNGKTADINVNGFIDGVYLVQVISREGYVNTKKILLR